jgi:hypothetical protein
MTKHSTGFNPLDRHALNSPETVECEMRAIEAALADLDFDDVPDADLDFGETGEPLPAGEPDPQDMPDPEPLFPRAAWKAVQRKEAEMLSATGLAPLYKNRKPWDGPLLSRCAPVREQMRKAYNQRACRARKRAAQEAARSQPRPVPPEAIRIARERIDTWLMADGPRQRQHLRNPERLRIATEEAVRLRLATGEEVKPAALARAMTERLGSSVSYRVAERCLAAVREAVAGR